MDAQKLAAVARGDEPADLLLTNARIINTFTGAIEEDHVAISQGRIAGVGDYREGQQVIDLQGKYLSPGLIDGHVHIESSFLNPMEYARAVVPRGVLGVITDCHEMANVCGVAGIKYILNFGERLPLDIFGMAPACVPSSHFESAGARIEPDDYRKLITMDTILGLGEMMNFPGIVFGEPSVWTTIDLFRGRIVDGHAPGLGGKRLNAYLAAGISSDHECTSLEEAREKLTRGMYIMIREGSSEKNLETLLPLVTDQTYRRCFFVVDERDPVDLLKHGDVDGVIRKAVSLGLDPVRAVQMATLIPAEHYRLNGLGAVAPGYRANLVVFNDLVNFEADRVFYNGLLVAQEGRIAIPLNPYSDPKLTRTMNIRPFDPLALRLPARGPKAFAIEIVPGQIVTRKIEVEVTVKDGFVQPDVEKDILKLIVVERHQATGNIGRGLVKGFGLKKGAVASSVAHDAHNVIAIGADDDDIFTAIKEVERLQGGIAIAAEGRVLGALALPISGLLSDEPLNAVTMKFDGLRGIVANLGCPLESPFTVLSFLSLPVIPELRLTDKGLVDVGTFHLTDEGGA